MADIPGLRPTPDRVRETLFNWLGQDLTGWRCLDAFAGSGALGFEAASRGAADVVLLERDRNAAHGLEQVRARLGAGAVRVHNADALRWMATCAPAAFDLVLLDPPFDAGLAEPALALTSRVLADGGQVYLESGTAHDPSALGQLGWQVRRASRAGQVHFALLMRG